MGYFMLSNIVCVPLSGQTGTGTFAGSTSTSFTSPTLDVATATSIAFSPTTNGIVGTTVGDNASSGYVGEFIFSSIPSASAVSLTSDTPLDITSISLTAGDWNVYGGVIFLGYTSPQTDLIGAWVSVTSATFPVNDFSVQAFDAVNNIFQYGNPGFAVPFQRVNISTTTNVYLSCYSHFTTNSVTAFGSIYARRFR